MSSTDILYYILYYTTILYTIVKSKKRENSTLSPNDSLAKQSKDDFFETVLDCDLTTFLSLNQDDVLSKFKSVFSKLDDVDQLRLDNSALTSQVSA